jgi:SPP1 family predicted phage head-tail adaptor
MPMPNLNRRIAIQSQTTSQDSFGQEQQTWTTQYECWAEIDVQQSQLIYSTAEFVSKVTRRITIRWTKSQVFQPNMRIVFVEPFINITHTYNIEAVLNPKQANFWLTFLCYELNAVE